MGQARFTPRQRQVLDLLAKRYTNRQIADELGISLEGAKWHVREVLEVTGAASREEAAEVWRAETGLPRRLWRMTWSAGNVALLAGAAAIVVAIGVGLVVAALRNGNQQREAGAPTASTASASPRPDATASPPDQATSSASPAPTATPGAVVFAPSRASGEPFVDYVTSHLESGVGLARADLAGRELPCTLREFTTAPDCPAGAAEGTLVLSIISFQCEIGWSALIPDARVLDDRDRLTLHSVLLGGSAYTRPPAASAAPDYWMLFTNATPGLPPGFAIAVQDEKVVSWGRSCGTFESLEQRLSEGSTGYLLSPQ